MAGYSEPPIRAFFAYLIVLSGLTGAYLVATNGYLGFGEGATQVQPLHWNDAIGISMTAFHGRGFFSAVFQPGDIQAVVATTEALVGLLLEIVFIATFTQRFFTR